MLCLTLDTGLNFYCAPARLPHYFEVKVTDFEILRYNFWFNVIEVDISWTFNWILLT